MKRGTKSKIVWGITFLIAAVGLLLFAFVPGFALLGVATWKWFVGLLLLYWLLRNAIFGSDLSVHFDVFLPLALLAILFESDIARLIGSESSDIYNNWLVAGAAVLLTISVKLLFRNRGVSKGKEKKYRFSSNVCYIDFTSSANQSVNNRLGETNIYCQNVDSADGSEFTLKVDNKMGQMNVHVPYGCRVITDIANSMGEVNDNTNGGFANGKTVRIIGRNKMGELDIFQEGV